METFEVTVNKQSYKIIRDNDHKDMFNVFNHSTFYTIKRNCFGIWEKVEHRFGADGLPIGQVGDEIDNYYNFLAFQGLFRKKD